MGSVPILSLCYYADMFRYIVISMGEPAGTSPEMILKSVNALSDAFAGGIIVTGDEGVFKRVASDLSIDMPFTSFVDSEYELKKAEDKGNKFIFYSSSSLDMDEFEYGKVSKDTGEASFRALEQAVSIIQNGLGLSLITCPVSVKALKDAGYEEHSVFALLSTFAASHRLVNMIKSGEMNIFSVTPRKPVMAALPSITRESIIDAIVSIDAFGVSAFFDTKKPIAVASFNPINADGEWTEKEEREAIIPGVEIAKRIGMNVVGPITHEALFRQAVKGDYSAILCMTTDVGYAASAAAYPDDSYLITWGLPFIRLGIIGGAGLEEAGKNSVHIKAMVTTAFEALRLSDRSYMV